MPRPKSYGVLLFALIIAIVLITTACSVLPSTSWSRLMLKTMPRTQVNFGNKFKLKLPYGFEKTNEVEKNNSLAITFEFRVNKAFYKQTLFNLNYEQLLVLTVVESPSQIKSYGKSIEVNGYQGIVYLYDDYSEDGHSNNMLSLSDLNRSLRLDLIIDKSQFTKAESIEILKNIFSSIQKL
jgi:hypothetical protein